jgi:hypothetical protein
MGFVFDVGNIVKLLDNYSFVPQFFVIWGLFCRLNIIDIFLAKFQLQICVGGWGGWFPIKLYWFGMIHTSM